MTLGGWTNISCKHDILLSVELNYIKEIFMFKEMLGNMSIVSTQVLTLFILIILGTILTKTKMINRKGIEQMTKMLLFIVNPCVIINSLNIRFEKEKAIGMIIVAACAVCIHFFAIIVGKYFFNKESVDKKTVLRYSVIFGNCGFMGIPMIEAVLGKDWVFYGVIYITIFQLYLWTYGVTLMSGEKKISLKKIFINPGVIGTSIALILFFSPFKLPLPIMKSVGYISNLNTPLSMIILGSFLVGINIINALKEKRLYIQAFLKLIFIPAAVIGVLSFLPIPVMVFRAISVSVCVPSAINVPLFATLYKKDAALSSRIVAFLTISSMITMPLLISLGALLIDLLGN